MEYGNELAFVFLSRGEVADKSMRAAHTKRIPAACQFGGWLGGNREIWDIEEIKLLNFRNWIFGILAGSNWDWSRHLAHVSVIKQVRLGGHGTA
jgi:hypothetical protein